MCRPAGVVDRGTTKGTGFESRVRHGCKIVRPFIRRQRWPPIWCSLNKMVTTSGLSSGQSLWLKSPPLKKKNSVCYILFNRKFIVTILLILKLSVTNLFFLFLLLNNNVRISQLISLSANKLFPNSKKFSWLATMPESHIL